MSNQVKNINLSDVLDAFVTEVELPLATTLTEWIQKYPQYAKELTEFAVAWSLLESAPIHEPIDKDYETLTKNDIDLINAMLQKTKKESSSTERKIKPIKNLVEEGRVAGFTLDEFADEVDLSVSLVRKLDRHLIQYLTVPLRVIESIALVLKREVVTIVRYLSLPPRPVSRASYRANQSPKIQQQENFFDAIRSDLNLTEERRERWLSLERDRE